MKEKAVVIAREEDCIWVETRRQSSCQSCSASKGCGQGLMSRLMPGREHYLRVMDDRIDSDQLAIGETVEIDVPDQLILQASAIVYLVPLLMLLAGMFVGAWISPGDPGAITGGLLGLLLGAGLVRLHAIHVRNDTRVQPRIVTPTTRDLAARL